MLRKNRTRYQNQFDTFLSILLTECLDKMYSLAELSAEGEQVGVLAPQRAAIGLSTTLWARAET